MRRMLAAALAAALLMAACGGDDDLDAPGIGAQDALDTDAATDEQPAGADDADLPEALTGDPVDGRSDLYSASVMLFEMLTGVLPFESADAGAMLAKHVSMPPPRLRHRGFKASKPLELAVARGLSKQPYDRYDSAGDFIVALAESAA